MAVHLAPNVSIATTPNSNVSNSPLAAQAMASAFVKQVSEEMIVQSLFAVLSPMAKTEPPGQKINLNVNVKMVGRVSTATSAPRTKLVML